MLFDPVIWDIAQTLAGLARARGRTCRAPAHERSRAGRTRAVGRGGLPAFSHGGGEWRRLWTLTRGWPIGPRKDNPGRRSDQNLTMPLLFALLTAFANARNVVTQHKASIAAPKRSRGWRFVLYLLRNPLWLFGWVALAGAFLFQALALHNGPISIVQPLLVTEPVFALVLRSVWIHQTIRTVTRWWAGVTCVTLAVFIAVAEPSGGSALPTRGVWVSAAAATFGCVAVLALLG